MNTKPALPPIQHSVCVALAADGALALDQQAHDRFARGIGQGGSHLHGSGFHRFGLVVTIGLR
jgi:hypothetical protein